jgi:hypothetical protein
MFDWWREYRQRRVTARAEWRARNEREFNEQSREYRDIIADVVRQVGAPLMATGNAAFASEEDGRRLRLTAVRTGSTIVEVEALWPDWKDLPGSDFEGTITVRGSDPADVYTFHAYDPGSREWYPTAATADSSWTAWWDREVDECVRRIVSGGDDA